MKEYTVPEGEGQAPADDSTTNEDAQAQQMLADAVQQGGTPQDGGEGAPAPSPAKVEDLPDWAQREIKKTRDEAASRRAAQRDAETKASESESKHQQTLDGIAKALGLKEEDASPDPEELAKQLQAKDAELAKAQEAERDAQRRTAAVSAMQAHEADVEAMTDSQSFAAELAKLDPNAEGFGDQVSELVKATLDKNPKYKAAGPAPPASTGDFSGGPGERKQRPKGLHAAFRRHYGGGGG